VNVKDVPERAANVKVERTGAGRARNNSNGLWTLVLGFGKTYSTMNPKTKDLRPKAINGLSNY
jgi:hypothetical protein